MKLRDSLLCVTLLSVPTFAAAQAAPPLPACSQNLSCASYFRQAQDLVKTNEKESLRLLLLAYEIVPDPILLYSIARRFDHLGDLDKAANYYQRFIDSPLRDETQQKKARALLMNLRSKLGPPLPPDVTMSAPPMPVLVPSPPAAPPAEPQLSGRAGVPPVVLRKGGPSPVYRKWWFWVAVGTATAAVVATGVMAAQKQPADTDPSGLPPAQLPSLIFHPFEP